MPPAHVDRIFNLLDLNNDNRIDLTEFIQARASTSATSAVAAAQQEQQTALGPHPHTYANARVFEMALFQLEELQRSVELRTGPHITLESLLEAFERAADTFGT